MSSCVFFEISCPNCAARLAGKRLKTESINFSELYSDGKMLCDGILSAEQRIVICPSCSHTFWIPEKSELKTYESNEIISFDNTVYEFSNWHQFGASTSKTDGKKALILHFQELLMRMKPFTVEQEIYLRKGLLWAINDLVREKRIYSLSDIFKGSFNFFSWRNERKEWLKQQIMYIKFSDLRVSNIKRLIELIRISDDKDINRAYIAELYREKGNFTKTIQLIGELSRSTHYVSLILEKAKKGITNVFKVAG
jgi:hypothetical protein